MTNEIIFFTKGDLEMGTKLVILKELYLYKKEENKICPICQTIQGQEKNGFKKYYCSHLREQITKKIKKVNLNLLNAEVICCNLLQDS